MEILRGLQRNLDTITEPAQKLHVINKYLKSKELTLREYPYRTKIQVLNPNESATQLTAIPINPQEFIPGQELSFYTLLAKFIQVDLKVLSSNEDGTVVFQINRIGIAKTNRLEPRIINNGTMYASNIVTSKVVIEANMFQIPTLVKVAFDEYKTKLNPTLFEFVKINIFQSSQPRRFNIVKKTGKILYLQDTESKESYFPKDTNCLSYDSDIDEDIESEMKAFKDELIRSEVIVPILYSANSSENPFPMGYIWVQNRERHIQPSDLLVLEKTAQDIVRRIHESNTMTVDAKFPIHDASRSGAQIAVEDEDLVNILPKQKSILLDIYFKLQPPLTVIGSIRWIAKKANNKLVLGLNFDGKSDNPGERARYVKNLENLRQSVELENL